MPTGAASASLVKAFIKEARQIQLDAVWSHAAHNEEARISDNLHYMLGVPTTLIAAAAGVTSFSAVGAGSTAAGWPNILAGVLSFLVVAMSGLTTFFDPKARATEHYRAAIKYSALRAEARYFSDIECKKGRTAAELDKTIQGLIEKWKKLDEQTPLVSTFAMARGTAKINAGDYGIVTEEAQEEGGADPADDDHGAIQSIELGLQGA